MADLLEVWRDGQDLGRLEARPVARRFLLQVVERVLEKVGHPLSAEDREQLHEVAYRRWLDTSQEVPRFRPHDETDKFTRPAYHLTFKSQPSQRPDGGPTFDRVLLDPWAEERHLAWQLGMQVDFRQVPGSPDRWLPEAIMAGVHAWAIDTEAPRPRGSYGQGNRSIHTLIWDRLEQAGVPRRLVDAWGPLGVTPERHGDLADGHLMLGVRLPDPGRWASTAELADYCAELLAAAWSVLPRPPEVQPVNRPQSQPASPSSHRASTEEGRREENAQEEHPREQPPRLAHRIARYLAARGLEYSPDQIAAVYTACKTKGFVILAGLSGTGKTRLARELAALLSARVCFQAVRPDWRDATPVLGYYNPFTRRYQETPILRFLWEAEAEWEEGRLPSPGEPVSDAQLADYVRRNLDPQHVDVLRAGLARWGRDPDTWTDEDVRELWEPYRNAMGDVGGAPRLTSGLATLREATRILADRHRGLGERVRDAINTFAATEKYRPFSRVLRALAALEPQRVPPVFQEHYLRRLLRVLGIARPVNLGIIVDGRRDPADLDACWDALTERLRDVVAEAGLPADDPAVRGRAAWVLARIAPQGSDGAGLPDGPSGAAAGLRPYFLILDEMNLARVEYYLADLLSAMETDRNMPMVLASESAGGPPAAASPSVAEAADGAGRTGATNGTTGAGDVEVRLTPNVYIIGTVNVDETTFAFSPKVLDRAFTAAFREVRLGPGYPAAPPRAGDGALSEEELDLLRRDFIRGGRCAGVDKDLVREAAHRHPWIVQALAELNEQLYPHDLHFGYRVVDEILAFVHLGLESPLRDGFEVLVPGAGTPAPADSAAHTEAATAAEPADGEANAGGPPDAGRVAFDWAVAMKLLPRFHGQRHRLEEPLEAVRRWAERYCCRRVVAEVERLQRRLSVDGFATYL